MTTEPTPPERAGLHEMWNSVAGNWQEHADFADERNAAMTERMLERARVGPGDIVLELACGPGGCGIEAARRVGADGEVTLSDVAPEMVEVAAARARAAGLTNVRTATLDIEDIAEADEAYDVVLCRDGLMFATDHVRAAREIRRVLRPGGRAAAAVWGPRDRNPWLSTLLDAASEVFGMPVPPPGIPGPFALDDPARVRGVFTEAGFSDVRVDEVSLPMRAATFDGWWNRTTALAGPLAALIAGSPEQTAHALRARVQERIAPYQTPDGLDLPGVGLLVLATP